MNLHIISAHADGHIDGTANLALYHHLPQTPNRNNADVVLVVISHYEDYKFNESLYYINKPIVIVDFMEYFGFLPLGETYLFGSGELPRNIRDSSEWGKLSAWVRLSAGSRLAYFKRELFSDCTAEATYPIEWPCMFPSWPIESKEAFNSRPFEVFYNWGYSNHLRPQMQASIFNLMAAGKIDAISNFDHIDAKIHEPYPKWIAIHSPHTHRRHFNEIQLRQSQSKCSISLPGSGVCCFRSVEAPLHTVPVICDYGKQWSIPWVSGENCINLLPSEVNALWLKERMADKDLHEIYINAQETLDRYRTTRYINEYLLPTIQKHL
jgi:hypothetical protein